MWRGWHFLPGGPIDTEPSMDAATTLDNSTGSAFRSPNVLVRPYFTGRPDPDQMADKCAEPPCAGHRIQLANEVNLGDEGFGGGPDDYAAWFIAVADRVPAGTRLYYGAPSPGVPGWEQYSTTPLAQQALARASGIVVHAYGTKDQMLQVSRRSTAHGRTSHYGSASATLALGNRPTSTRGHTIIYGRSLMPALGCPTSRRSVTSRTGGTRANTRPPASTVWVRRSRMSCTAGLAHHHSSRQHRSQQGSQQ